MLDIRNCDRMELMSEFPDNHFDLAIDDPPYGIGENGSSNHTRNRLTQATKYRKYHGEDKEPPPKEYFRELKRVSKNQIVWGANHFIDNIESASSPCWIVWDKNTSGDFADCELAYTSFKTAVRMFKYTWCGMRQEDMKNKELRIHPNQKPVALFKWCLSKYAKPGDKILGNHFGSASIAIACYYMGFDLVACDLDKDYYTDAMNRIKIETAQADLFS